ncbi:Midgut chymotrypsin, partial [Operophtera brumata]
MWTLLILLGVFGLSNGVPLETLGSRIIGGEDAPEHYAPHMVSLFSRGLRLMQWDADTIKNDVGILVLKELLKLGRGVAMIGLGFGWVGGDERCYQLAPTPDDLQLLFVSTLGPEQCVANLSAAQWGAGVTPALDQRVEICTFHSGDSGSALVSSATGLQIGVVSWGLPCARGVPD